MLSNRENKQSAGFTLIELMIVMAMVGIVAAAMYAAFEAQVRGQVSQDISLAMTQNLRAAIDLIASDIRMAGCDPDGSSGATIEAASANSLLMTMDIGGGAQGQPDGVIGPGERVQYAINTGGNLGRAVDNGNLDPLHGVDLQCDALNFVYLDVNDTPFVPATAADRNRINAIQVSIVIRSADTGVANPGLLRSYTNNTVYRNLQGVAIYTAPGDTARRFQLSETVDCRNL